MEANQRIKGGNPEKQLLWIQIFNAYMQKQTMALTS